MCGSARRRVRRRPGEAATVRPGMSRPPAVPITLSALLPDCFPHASTTTSNSRGRPRRGHELRVTTSAIA